MTYSKLAIFGLMLWVFLAVLKVIVFQSFDIGNIGVLLLFLFLTYVISMAMARRLGVINFIEGALVVVLWTVLVLCLDVLVLYAIIHAPIFNSWQVWAGYGVMMLSIFFFHKKRHIQVRKEQAHHHGHH